ncbi:MAG: DUF362 domain-containing protein [Planctomycetota bacterium]|jgi:uncharacterized protein (DUF362 family)/Pyruvate/2-oxoacid:ferredoxin oxidoreductase delta subunit
MSEPGSTLAGAPRFREAASATVGTARCLAYKLNRVRQAIKQCIQELPDIQEMFRNAHSVLLKPNLLSSSADPERHINTHPALVQVLAEMLIFDFHCDVSIGDSCGTLSRGSTARALRNSGMEEVARETGAELYNVDAQPRHVVSFPQGQLFTEIPLPSNLDQFDLILSVAKLKTHNLTYVTGPVKNMLGLVPGAGKKQAHLKGARAEEFATLLCDLYELVRPGAAFVDGIIGMEGRGPANGVLRHLELVAASCDPVALDSFCAQVMGFDPLRIPLLARCQRRGLGVADPAEIIVRGEPASAFAPEDFAKPAAYGNSLLLRVMPRWLFRGALGAFTSYRATIDQDRCTRCGECLRNCPSSAIWLDAASERYQVERKKCIACYCCAEVCPSDAVRMRSTWVRRGMEMVASPFR